MCSSSTLHQTHCHSAIVLPHSVVITGEANSDSWGREGGGGEGEEGGEEAGREERQGGRERREGGREGEREVEGSEGGMGKKGRETGRIKISVIMLK